MALQPSVLETLDIGARLTIRKREEGQIAKSKKGLKSESSGYCGLDAAFCKEYFKQHSMNLLCWKFKGFGNSNTHQVLLSFCPFHKPALLYLVVSLIYFDLFPCSFWNSLNVRLLAVIKINSASMWILASNFLEDVFVLNCEDQLVSIVLLVGEVRQVVSIICGSVLICQPKFFWVTLVYLALKVNQL